MHKGGRKKKTTDDTPTHRACARRSVSPMAGTYASWPTLHMHMPGGALFGQVANYYKNQASMDNDMKISSMMAILGGGSGGYGSGIDASGGVSAAGQVRQLAQIRNQFKSLQKDRAAKSQGVMNDFLDFVYHVENGYEIDAFRSVLNEVFVVGYRLQQNGGQASFAGAVPITAEALYALAAALATYGYIQQSDFENIPRPNPLVTSLITLPYYIDFQGIYNLYSKGGKQNVYDHEISSLSSEEWEAWKKENSNQKNRIKKEEKRRGNANSQKRQSRGY